MRALEVAWALFTVAAGLAPLLLTSGLGESIDGRALVPAVAAAAIALAGATLAWRGRLRAALGAVVLAAAAFYAPLLTWTLPGLDPLWPSRGAGAARAGAGRARPLAAVGYREPSLLVIAGADVALLDADGAARFLVAQPNGLVLVAEAQRAAFVAAARRHGLTLRTLWSAPGINYSKGERVDLHLFAAQ